MAPTDSDRNFAPAQIVVALDAATLDTLAAQVVARLRADTAPTPRYLVGPTTPAEGMPAGHTVRELYDARRRGALVADLTPGGLVFTEQALRAYQAQRRQRKTRPAIDTTTEPSVARALERAGIVLSKRAAGGVR